MVTLYVLKATNGRRTVGITNDLQRRIREHRSQTSKTGLLVDQFFVLYTQQFPDYAEARIQEKFLKSGQGRKWIDALEKASEPARGG